MVDSAWKILFVHEDENSPLLTFNGSGFPPDSKIEKIIGYSLAREVLSAGLFDIVFVCCTSATALTLEFIHWVAGKRAAPVILLANPDDSEMENAARFAGAADYIPIDEFSPGVARRAARYSIKEWRLVQSGQNTQQQKWDIEENTWLQAVIDNVPTGIIFVNKNGEFTLSNLKIRELFEGGITGNSSGPAGGYTLRHLDGSLFSEDELPLQRALQGISSQDVELLVCSDNGREKILLANSAPVFAPDGSITGALAVMQDITENKQAQTDRDRLIRELQNAHQAAERAIIESREVAHSAIASAAQLEAILNSLTDSVMVYDQYGVVQMANSFAVAMFGFDPLRMNRRSFAKRLVMISPNGHPVPPDEMPSALAARGEIVLNRPLTIRNPRGRTYEVLASALPLYVGKEFLGVVAVLNDITEREQLRQQIEDDRSRLETIIQNAPDGIILAGADLQILLSNPAAVDLLGDSVQAGKTLNAPERLFDHPLLQPDGQPFQPDSLPLVCAIREGRIFHSVEAHVKLASGEKRALLINASPIKDNDNQVTGGVGLFRDITEMQETQNALKVIEAEQVMHRVKAVLQRELGQHRERERTQIARDLHDGPLQELIATSFMLVDAMTIDTKEERLTRMRAMQESLQKNIRDLRTFCNDLRPPVLASFGLEKTIRSHIESFRASHPEVRVRADLMPDGKILPESESMVIFRAYQEALNNIIKHARASEVRISLLVQQQRVTLEIKDNGVGFNVPSDWVEVARSGHLGLIGMRERVESIGGTVVIRSKPNQGTRLEITVPVQALADRPGA